MEISTVGSKGDNNEDAMSFFFASEAAPSFIIKPDYTLSRKLVVSGSATEDAEIVVDYGGGDFHHAAPVAYGAFNSDGSRFTGTQNLTAVWNSASNQYELTLDGESFNFSNYTVSVTPVGSIPRLATITSGLSKLRINMFDLNGNRVQESFQVIIYDNRSVSLD